MSKHTQEPWHVVPEYTGCNGEEVTAGIYDDDDGSPNLMIGEFEDRADAGRAVDCVSALAGIEDPAAYVKRCTELEAEVERLRKKMRSILRTTNDNAVCHAEQLHDIEHYAIEALSPQEPKRPGDSNDQR